ncbi:hypothetical protein ACFQL1_22020 [Halomicroarcula sp. GCM10025709]|uniref:hypothetical protein n=1 Tax=Haloarcula TaxID=2237 RepID=UPI0024C39A3F|nr:hypothetical protein [Halomicroarcula sp. YJ-61-S]
MAPEEPDICPYPGHDTVRCPECRTDIPGLVPDGSPEDPEPRCPACGEVIDTVIITDG